MIYRVFSSLFEFWGFDVLIVREFTYELGSNVLIVREFALEESAADICRRFGGPK